MPPEATQPVPPEAEDAANDNALTAANDNDLPANDNAQDMMMIGTAAMFDFVKFIFALFFIFAPIILCGGLAAYVYSKTGSTLAGKAACVIGGGLGIFADLTGFGAAALEAVGEVFADAISGLAWITFIFWFYFRGMGLFTGKKSTARYLITAAGFTADMIPLLNIAPWTTISVTAMIWQKRKENELALAAANDNRVESSTDEGEERAAAQRSAIQLQLQRRALQQQSAESGEAAPEDEEGGEDAGETSNVVDFASRQRSRPAIQRDYAVEQQKAA